MITFIVLIITLLILGLGGILLTAASDQPELIKNEPKSDVYFTSDISAEGVMKAYRKVSSGMDGKIGLKVHFGEEGNSYYVIPELLKELQKATHSTLVETNVIYPGPRQNTESHLKLAKEHGFDFAPIDILDSEGEIALTTDSRYFNEVWVGSHYNNYNSYIICSHFKGHVMSGFGGAVKNVSMGFGSRTGKIAMHSSHYPKFDPLKCINCGLCLKNCAVNAISLNPLKLNPGKCVGCGKCIAICPQKVFSNQGDRNDHDRFMEKLVDYAKTITKNKKAVYINFVINVSSDCDCMAKPHKPFTGDIGILSSTDPVALDNACLDLVNQAIHSEDAFKKVNNVSGNHLIDYGNKVELGLKRYRLINIDKN